MQVRPIHTATVIGIEGHPIQSRSGFPSTSYHRYPSSDYQMVPYEKVQIAFDLQCRIQDSYFRGREWLSTWHRLVSKKSGTLFDLPIALAILQMDGQLASEVDLNHCLVVGELSLSGELRPI